jgi:hypothetical protein
MTIADLMNSMSYDFENILEKYKKERADSYMMDSLSQTIIHKMNEYQFGQDIFGFEVRVRSEKDLVIAFEAPEIEIGFIYAHLVVRNFKADLKFNVNIFPLNH